MRQGCQLEPRWATYRMDTIRWIIVFVVVLPAAVFTFVNFCLAVRRVIYFTDSGPSWIPLFGSLAALIGLIAVPKTGSTPARSFLIAFCVFLVFDGSYGMSDIVNKVRAWRTGRRPS